MVFAVNEIKKKSNPPTDNLLVQVELPPPDLGPSSALNQTLNLLREVLASHDSSVVPLDARQADFVQVQVCLTALKRRA